MTDWYSMNDMCATCGRPFGDHLGTYCFGNGLDEFVLLTKPTPSLGALLRQALERNKQAPANPNAAMIARDGKAKPAPAAGGAKFYDEGWNAAHDGEPFNVKATRDWRDGWNDYQDAGPEHKVRLDFASSLPASTAKPPIAGLTLSPDLRDSGHQVSPGFGSALL